MQDLLATAGDYLRVWRVDDDSQQVELHAKLDNNQTSEFCAPLTAFDWNETQPSIIGYATRALNAFLPHALVGTLTLKKQNNKK